MTKELNIRGEEYNCVCGNTITIFLDPYPPTHVTCSNCGRQVESNTERLKFFDYIGNQQRESGFTKGGNMKPKTPIK